MRDRLGDVVVVVIVVADAVAFLVVKRRSVVEITAVVVEVEGTARTADTAGPGANAALSVIVVNAAAVVIQPEEGFLFRQFLLGNVDQVLQRAMGRGIEEVPVVVVVR